MLLGERKHLMVDEEAHELVQKDYFKRKLRGEDITMQKITSTIIKKEYNVTD